MYRRYSSASNGNSVGEHGHDSPGAPQRDNGGGRAEQSRNAQNTKTAQGNTFSNTHGGADERNKPPRQADGNRTHGKNKDFDKKPTSPVSPLLKFIPQSIYNPETGKVLGFLSAEDLLIAALILLLIDNRNTDEDNSLLIYALVYILISDRINLPF